MPIYEYQCAECGHAFDALQKMSDDPLKDCPDCGESSLRKLLSAPNFRLKGSGWYETDFKDKNKRNLAGDAGKESSNDSSKDPSAKSTDGKSSTDAKSDKGGKGDKGGKSGKAGGDSKPKAKPVNKSAD
jgi:putative FmdB family regulatory protein